MNGPKRAAPLQYRAGWLPKKMCLQDDVGSDVKVPGAHVVGSSRWLWGPCEAILPPGGMPGGPVAPRARLGEARVFSHRSRPSLVERTLASARRSETLTLISELKHFFGKRKNFRIPHLM